jgi:hypothetical protein
VLLLEELPPNERLGAEELRVADELLLPPK